MVQKLWNFCTMLRVHGGSMIDYVEQLTCWDAPVPEGVSGSGGHHGR